MLFGVTVILYFLKILSGSVIIGIILQCKVFAQILDLAGEDVPSSSYIGPVLFVNNTGLWRRKFGHAMQILNHHYSFL